MCKVYNEGVGYLIIIRKKFVPKHVGLLINVGLFITVESLYCGHLGNLVKCPVRIERCPQIYTKVAYLGHSKVSLINTEDSFIKRGSTVKHWTCGHGGFIVYKSCCHAVAKISSHCINHTVPARSAVFLL